MVPGGEPGGGASGGCAAAGGGEVFEGGWGRPRALAHCRALRDSRGRVEKVPTSTTLSMPVLDRPVSPTVSASAAWEIPPMAHPAMLPAREGVLSCRCCPSSSSQDSWPTTMPSPAANAAEEEEEEEEEEAEAEGIAATAGSSSVLRFAASPRGSAVKVAPAPPSLAAINVTGWEACGVPRGSPDRHAAPAAASAKEGRNGAPCENCPLLLPLLLPLLSLPLSSPPSSPLRDGGRSDWRPLPGRNCVSCRRVPLDPAIHTLRRRRCASAAAAAAAVVGELAPLPATASSADEAVLLRGPTPKEVEGGGTASSLAATASAAAASRQRGATVTIRGLLPWDA